MANPVVVTGWLAAPTVLFGVAAFQGGTAMEVGGGFDPQVLRLVGLPPLALSPIAAPLSKRWGATVTARIGLLVSALGLVLAGVGGFLTVAAAALVSGGVGLAVPGLIATLGSAASDHSRGLALSVYIFSLFVGASLAAPVSTALARQVWRCATACRPRCPELPPAASPLASVVDARPGPGRPADPFTRIGRSP